MRKITVIAATLFCNGILFAQNWSTIKANVSPVIEISNEYDSIYRQSLATTGWEDGVHVSDDGLNLYCTYAPIDLLSFAIKGGLPNNFSTTYMRNAPTFGMDLTTNPINAAEWLHSDVLFAHRNSVKDPFSTWQLSDMARTFYSEGAPTPVFKTNDAQTVEFMLFTSNDNANNNTDIWVIKNTLENPSGVGVPFSATINSIYTEDNPNLVRIDDKKLVLFFDSDNRPGGLGDIDIWFSESTDNGVSWSVPINVSSVNTTKKEHQPFLYQDLVSKKWFLYYSAVHTDGKLAIYRRPQTNANNWNSWGNPELVISAGNSAGIGEPTLTRNGDISFVVVYEDPAKNSDYDHFDSDPWFLRKKALTTGLEHHFDQSKISVFPNPMNNILIVESENVIQKLELYDNKGVLLITSQTKSIQTQDLAKGVFVLRIQLESGQIEYRKLMKQ